jgi:hypothetical protein
MGVNSEEEYRRCYIEPWKDLRVYAGIPTLVLVMIHENLRMIIVQPSSAQGREKRLISNDGL